MPDETNSESAPKPNPKTDTPPAAEPPPKLPKLSFTVEPFHSAGGPPPDPSSPKHGKPKVLLAIVLVLVVAGAAAYWLLSPTINAPKSSPTPSASSEGAFDSDLQGVDSAMGDLNSNLTDVDTTLADKQGDLSE
jgi:hypothetical protein